MEHEWVSMYDYLPYMTVKKSEEEGGLPYLVSEYVLVWDGSRVDIAQVVYDESGLYWLDRYAEVVQVVSWMPLPTPPEQLKEK